MKKFLLPGLVGFVLTGILWYAIAKILHNVDKAIPFDYDTNY